ncbi:MAG: prepilin-type N-terminal cleavage/methylation domain-containing protein [Planctomycetes bacterium]|nr:prepilin-type N-terminal cleavage/methylation domain-containing protein [Planctomycetota bacterium]
MIFQISMKNGKTSNDKLICGFTLVELLLVLVLMAISVATIVPRIGDSVSGWQVREISKNMLATIKLSRQLALTRQEVIFFALDTDSTSFTIKKAGRTVDLYGTAEESLVPRQFLGKGATIVRLEGFQDIGNEKSLVFWPDGRTEKAHVILTSEKDSKTAQWHIFIENDGSAVLREVANK